MDQTVTIIIIVILIALIVGIFIAFYYSNSISGGLRPPPDYTNDTFKQYAKPYDDYIDPIINDYDILGEYCVYQNPDFPHTEIGWKIHVSPKAQYIVQVVDIVRTYCHGRYMYKFKLNASYGDLNVYNGQYGKFIAIYPPTEADAVNIAEDLHHLFMQNNLDDTCFIDLHLDFKIYPGIFTRLAGYYRDFTNSRHLIGFSLLELNEYLEFINSPETIFTYRHPFKSLTAFGIEIPKLLIDVNMVLTYCYCKYIDKLPRIVQRGVRENASQYYLCPYRSYSRDPCENSKIWYRDVQLIGQHYIAQHLFADNDIDIDIRFVSALNLACNSLGSQKLKQYEERDVRDASQTAFETDDINLIRRTSYSPFKNYYYCADDREILNMRDCYDYIDENKDKDGFQYPFMYPFCIHAKVEDHEYRQWIEYIDY